MKKFFSDAIYSELDDVDVGPYDIDYDLDEMILSLSHRNRLTRRKFHIYDEEPRNRKRNRVRTKPPEFIGF